MCQVREGWGKNTQDGGTRGVQASGVRCQVSGVRCHFGYLAACSFLRHSSRHNVNNRGAAAMTRGKVRGGLEATLISRV